MHQNFSLFSVGRCVSGPRRRHQAARAADVGNSYIFRACGKLGPKRVKFIKYLSIGIYMLTKIAFRSVARFWLSMPPKVREPKQNNKTPTPMKYKLLLVCALAIASMATVVRADEITVTGTTSGTFSLTGTNNNNELTFTGTAFSETTFDGNAGFALGQITQHASAVTHNYNGETFTLTVTFTAPPGTSGPGNFTATLTGSVNTLGNGSVFFNFANDHNNPQHFTFAGGSFDFYVDDITSGRGTRDLQGGVTNVHIPDGGSTLALLGMAMVGAAALRRKLGL
jgi:hypothetical protein